MSRERSKVGREGGERRQRTLSALLSDISPRPHQPLPGTSFSSLRGLKVWWGEVTLVKPIIITTRSRLSLVFTAVTSPMPLVSGGGGGGDPPPETLLARHQGHLVYCHWIKRQSCGYSLSLSLSLSLVTRPKLKRFIFIIMKVSQRVKAGLVFIFN